MWEIEKFQEKTNRREFQDFCFKASVMASAHEFDKWSSCTMFVHGQVRGPKQTNKNKPALSQSRKRKSARFTRTGVCSVVRGDARARTPRSYDSRTVPKPIKPPRVAHCFPGRAVITTNHPTEMQGSLMKPHSQSCKPFKALREEVLVNESENRILNHWSLTSRV